MKAYKQVSLFYKDGKKRHNIISGMTYSQITEKTSSITFFDERFCKSSHKLRVFNLLIFNGIQSIQTNLYI